MDEHSLVLGCEVVEVWWWELGHPICDALYNCVLECAGVPVGVEYCGKCGDLFCPEVGVVGPPALQHVVIGFRVCETPGAYLCWVLLVPVEFLQGRKPPVDEFDCLLAAGPRQFLEG
jgi:hypothetical protein